MKARYKWEFIVGYFIVMAIQQAFNMFHCQGDTGWWISQLGVLGISMIILGIIYLRDLNREKKENKL